ncbi:acetyl-CoA carboxylase biotin carboxyl carrier protein [Nocardia caishijiensis]|uniref:Biotin carboxyl carrier protein of acetyl-CoA carboxylase n=1 Tax=Nocardia caishijiensis TaxID=184756 RepID=A0ABQ6YQH2_9NOCA|nr:biotin/lipoyl-containing protein [Nocardia caishijiensis]KAF0847736.1 acetyl-CoA carboxylase biotin carboxyl carrier protein [Nocardia caishijiensis]
MTTDKSLSHMIDEVRGLVADLHPRPRRLRVRAGEFDLEMEWPDEPEATSLPPAQVVAVEPAGPAPDSTTVAIESPLVGHFFRSPEPGADPFVAPGDVVQEGQVVAIVEAMKLMNRITAPGPGRVVRILPADGDVVEYGQQLILLEPDESARMEIAS